MDDEPEPTWVEVARALMRQPAPRILFLVGCAVALNLVAVIAQGGPDGIRRRVRNHAIEAERLKQRQEQIRKDEEWSHAWELQRRRSDDDNYAK